MKLLPRSLFARLGFFTVFTAVLLFLITLLVYFWFPFKAYEDLDAESLISRLTAIVNSVESLPTEQSHELLEQLYTPIVNISLADEPFIKDGHTPQLSHHYQIAHRSFELFTQEFQKKIGPDYTLHNALFELTQANLLARQQDLMDPETSPAIADDLNYIQSIVPQLPVVVGYSQLALNNGQWLIFEYHFSPLHRLFGSLLFTTLAALFIAFCFILILLLGWVTQPLRKFAKQAQRLSHDIENAEPSPEEGPSELQAATHALNQMQARLKHFIHHRVMLLAAISHDLQTPLTRMRLDIEQIDEAAIKQSLLDEINELSSMITATLNASEDLTQDERLETIDIMSMLEVMQEEAQTHNEPMTLSGEITTPVAVKSLSIKRCLQNLIDNAIRYGHVAKVHAREDEHSVYIEVSDKGPGIPEAQFEQVFEPFYRLEPSRNRDTGGTGLGLSIALQIALAHGGTLTLKNKRPNGLIVTLTLPKVSLKH